MSDLQVPRLLLSQVHPLAYALAVGVYRMRRRARWLAEDMMGKRVACARSPVRLPVRVKRHQSRLLRQLGTSEMWMQHNKVKNIAIAIRPLDGLLIQPGETFSFWRRVGRPTPERGFVEGMEISRGEARPGMGGGICQIASVLHWLVLHSPLVVTERSIHSYDPFPDNARSIPYGTGCSVFYNYIDFQFCNPTSSTFQIVLWLSERFLEAELRASANIEHSYTVVEKDQAFLPLPGRYYRRNSLWRRVCDRRTGSFVREELIKRNFVRVKYVPSEM